MEDSAFDLPLALSMLAMAILMTAVIFRNLWRQEGVVRSFCISCVVILFSTVSVFLALEWLFRTQVEMSDGWHITSASQRWNKKHWHPINSQGFRDFEHSRTVLQRAKILLVVGDSFVTGHGIEGIKDRFANIIGTELGPEWIAVVLARNGWNTRQELDAIRSYRPIPTAVLLSYYVNDIEIAELDRGQAAQFVAAPKGRSGWLVERSHLVNFLYWRIYRCSLGDEYWKHLQESYASQARWSRHAADLTSLVRYAVERDIELSVIVWPHLTRVEESMAITSKVVAAFDALEVPALDLPSELSRRRPAELIVNSLDVHPNRRLHREVAQLWMERIGGDYKELD